ncbi:MAG: hypothetical protein RLY57_188 [Candidatus Parcubacteria bacterium]|jgi:hypothetical protein
MNNIHQKATPWVSNLVLLGCIAITAVLVYMSQHALAISEEWNPESRFSEYLSN